MARRYLTPIDLTGLELTNFKIQNLASNPTAYGKGHTYYNISANELRTYNGTEWLAVGGKIGYGPSTSLPAAGHAGSLYFDTDKSVLLFDNGTSWVQDGVTTQDVADAIANAALTSTDDLSEGINNLYYTDGRVDTRIQNNLGIYSSNVSGNILFNSTVGAKYAIGGDPTVANDTEIATHQWVLDNSTNYISGIDTKNLTVTNETLSLNDEVSVTKVNYQYYDGTGYTTLGSIYGDGLTAGLTVKSSNGGLNLTTEVGHIIFNPNGAVYSNGDLHVQNGKTLYAERNLYVGGNAGEWDGALLVQNSNGFTVASMGANGSEGTISVNGHIDLYTGLDGSGQQYGSLTYDNDSNFVINGNYGDVIINPTSGYAYIGNNGSPSSRIATQGYVDSVAQGLDVKASVVVASTENIDLSSPYTGISGSGNTIGDRVLLKDQTDASENGIYVVGGSPLVHNLTRATDATFDISTGTGNLTKGSFVFVEQGTNAGHGYVVSNIDVSTGVWYNTWTQFSETGQYITSVGYGLTVSSAVLDLDVQTNSGLSTSATAGLRLMSPGTASGLELDTISGTYQLMAPTLTSGLVQEVSGTYAIDTAVVVRKHAQAISSDGTMTDFTITHNLGTEDVIVSVYDAVTKEVVITDVTNFTTNTVKIGFAEPPADGAYRVVIHG